MSEEDEGWFVCVESETMGDGNGYGDVSMDLLETRGEFTRNKMEGQNFTMCK